MSNKMIARLVILYVLFLIVATIAAYTKGLTGALILILDVAVCWLYMLLDDERERVYKERKKAIDKGVKAVKKSLEGK